MAAFHRAGRERINVFPVGDAYLFRHYLAEEAFAELREFYDRYEYRFSVPAGRWDRARAVLERHGYEPVEVDDFEPYAVVKRKYSSHPDVVFSAAVLHRSVDRFNCFVLKDRESVERAVAGGARPIAETDIDVPV